MPNPVSSVKPSRSAADRTRMRSRKRRVSLPLLVACAGASVLLAPAAAAKQATASWARPQIQTVVAHGLMAPSVAAFQPNSPLSSEEMDELLPALPAEPLSEDSTDTTTTATTTTPTTTTPTTTYPNPPTTTTPPTTYPYPTTTDPTTTTTTTDPMTTPSGLPPGSPQPGAPVSVTAFDTALVERLGLSTAAARFQSAARQARLTPPKRFGTEVVARLLGLRTNHPASQDKLELLPNDPITRAEVAYSVAQVLDFRGGEAEWVDEMSQAITLPVLSGWQKRILNYTVSFVGYPYIWGGINPKSQVLFGRTVPGGFDCSGLIWRVYKLRRYPGGGRLSSTIRGRTTYVMSGEVPRSKRIAFDNLQPGDVIFFGLKGRASKPGQVNHTAIYLGGGWFVQSSGNGVDVVPLEGWYYKRFAWARRPLAEAGLVNVYTVQNS
jgi:cell wall-associated NlpC family hydrolase